MFLPLTPQKSKIDTTNCHFITNKLPFPNPIILGPAVSFQGYRFTGSISTTSAAPRLLALLLQPPGPGIDGGYISAWWLVGFQPTHLKKYAHQIGSFPQMSHEKNPPTFYYTGWLIGILIMVYYNALYNSVV